MGGSSAVFFKAFLAVSEGSDVAENLIASLPWPEHCNGHGQS